MPDEPTAWELQRNYQQLRADVQTGFAGVNSRLDRLPSEATILAWNKAIEDRQHVTEGDVARLEGELRIERERREQMRRLVVGAVLAALGSLFVLIASTVIGLPT